ncbi:TIGR01777 family protein [Alcaligenaceae bacterium]|nr:TIGR01777 family protein [Alcaligenaceae bacterium]
MRILLTGGTGLIGRELCKLWNGEGHELIVLSRQPQNVPQLCSGARGIQSLDQLNDTAALDAVINLAGAPIADRPWTKARREVLWKSRVDLTQNLVSWLANQAIRPSVLISGSATGIYGDCGDAVLDENSPTDTGDFGSKLCVAWEEAARDAETLGIRVVRLRTAPVLAPNAGMLAKMKLPFSLGLGGRLGNGQQWMPWIHLADEVGLIDFLLHCDVCTGAWNACAPQTVRNAEFVRALGLALHRPTVLPVPAALLRLALGEMSILLLGGQRVQAHCAHAASYRFQFERLDEALIDVLY